MNTRLLTLILLFTFPAWGNQSSPETKAKEMAEAACRFQYEVINSRFVLGFSEDKAIQTASVILTKYLEKNGESASYTFVTLLRKNIIAQLRELEANKEAVEQLKSPPADFKSKFLSSCNDMKTKQLLAMHVFG